ncbi:helix-turn-helix domain-containing protein [Pseudoduganella namucuonensis]|uniref:Transcriptional regulator, AraC family n=1 Tax=Pseudoduganella namucuonensis TaxID=1035707 RepID=A0A1I7LZ65_9BURK|nr:helix-turn-helix domain-containing protein [Pseudoduganella namucuonensis]SFV14945.1 transcriptional regulator, AraC family [Pseudoduganella namucuonensis]
MDSDPTHIQRWKTDDIEEQSGLLHGWEQEYRQLSCGKFTGNVSTARGPRMTILGESTNQSLHESIVPPAGELVFGLVLNRDNALQVNRREVSTSALLVLEGGTQYDFCTDGSTDLLGFSMEREVFFDNDQGRHAELLRNAIRQNVVPLEPGATMMLRQFWLMLSQILQREETWPSSMPLSLLAETALNNILLALNMSSLQPGESLPQSSERQALVVQRAIRYMRTNLERDFSIADVCNATHVSQRTLQYHFENCLKMSPQQYLKVLRLNTARSMIRKLGEARAGKAAPTSIAEIAARCGYAHASRFAGDYKRQFGDLPSETLRGGTPPA